MPPREFTDLMGIVRSYQRSQALAVAARLGIADLLADAPQSVEELARITDTHAPTLYRLLRALASIGVFTELEGHAFEHNATSEYLRTDHDLSVAPVAEMFCSDYEWTAWGALDHSVRTGENAATHALGLDVWEHRRLHPEAGRTFDAAMRTTTRANADELSVHDFGPYAVVADIGGGSGALISTILRDHPQQRAILFDQPHVVENAPPVLAAAGVADRVEVVGGSFFESVPTGADAYVLRRILHDWTDDKCVEILQCVRRAMTPAARLIVIDAVIAAPNEGPLPKWLDLMMLVSAGGRERTLEEWDAVLASGGFRLVSSTTATATTDIIVAAPV